MGCTSLLSNYKLNSILTAVGEIILGVILIFKPTASKSVICVIAGVGLLIYGVLGIFAYLQNHKFFWDHARLIFGIVAIVLGLIFLFWPRFILSFLGRILGMCLTASACSQILRSLTLRAFHFGQWWTTFLIGILFVVLGLSLILFPVVYGNLLMQFIGVFLVIEAVSDLLTVRRISELAKNVDSKIGIRY